MPADATPVRKLALRDGAIALAALSLWAAGDAWQRESGGLLAGLVALLDGIGAGVVLGLLAHEWGHFVGARSAGGIAPTQSLTSFFPIFQFDMQQSPPRAFRSMSVAGNVAHWSVFLVLFIALPLDSIGGVALVSGAFGFAVGASTTEFPVISRAYSGVPPTECFQGLTGDVLRRNRNIGIAAGLVALLVL